MEPSRSAPPSLLPDARPTIVLASADARLLHELRGVFSRLGERLETASSGDEALAAVGALDETGGRTGVLLLDTRLPGVANGRLLAALNDRGARMRWAMALVADHVSDEWIVRLREGIIDDIVSRSADPAEWKTHLSTMQRGHALYCEVEHLRESSLLEIKHDAVTGVLNRDTMLTILFRETDRIQRLHGTLSVMALGIDDFPRWAAELGAEGRDQMLREVARRCARLLRTYDALGRLGGDEFLLILPGCGTVNAALLAERLRMEVFGEPIWIRRAQGQVLELRLSACFGIALSRGRSPVVVAREAEQALRQARLQGAGIIRCTGDTGGEPAGEARLFPELETVSF